MYVIWNIKWQGYRPKMWDAKHGGIFAAKRFSTLTEAAKSCFRHDVVHKIGADGIPRVVRLTRRQNVTQLVRVAAASQ